MRISEDIVISADQILFAEKYYDGGDTDPSRPYILQIFSKNRVEMLVYYETEKERDAIFDEISDYLSIKENYIRIKENNELKECKCK